MTHLLERDAVLRLIEEIEVVMTAHQIWLNRFNQALLFEGGMLIDVEQHNAYLKTPFGQWYHANYHSHVADYPDFKGIGDIQKEMHETASLLCRDRRQTGRMKKQDYDHCMNLSLHLTASMRSLQLDIIGELLAIDPLTGCLGRRGMLDKLKGEHERADRLGQPCCICMLDFDHFKRINDERGHAAGDAALNQGMKFVLSHLRKYDSLYRYGGEEFLLALPNTPLQDAVNIVERLRSGLETLEIVPSEGEPFHVTASFGLVELTASRSVEASINAADQALYRAKRGGRNWVEIESFLGLNEEAIRSVLSNPHHVVDFLSQAVTDTRGSL